MCKIHNLVNERVLFLLSNLVFVFLLFHSNCKQIFTWFLCTWGQREFWINESDEDSSYYTSGDSRSSDSDLHDEYDRRRNPQNRREVFGKREDDGRGKIFIIWEKFLPKNELIGRQLIF